MKVVLKLFLNCPLIKQMRVLFSLPRTEQVRVSSEMGLERTLDDGYSWRKYGQKDILGSSYPRYRTLFLKCILINTFVNKFTIRNFRNMLLCLGFEQ